MEDRVLSSMCIDPTSYCSFSEQGEALKQGQAARRMVSRDGNTYIHMVVPILTHWVAVQVTISPFALEKFPGQTFFSSQLRYGPCCRQIHDGGTLDAVRDTVQKVIDSFYRPVCWNYSGQCCTLDHSNNTDIEQCIPVIKSRFQAYASSACTRGHPYATESLAQDSSIIASRLPDDQLIATESTSLDKPFNIKSLLAPANSTNTQTCPSQGNTTSIICNAFNAPGIRVLQSSSASCKRKFGNTGPLEEFNGTGCPAKQRFSKDQQDAQLAQNTTAWIKEGLQNLSIQNFPRLVTPSDTVLSQSNEEAQACADYLWTRAEEVENASATFVWSLRFIAACALLVGTTHASSSEIVQPGQACRKSIHHWRCGAEIINWIVNGMLPTWKEEAYLIYHVFAAKGQSLSTVARLSQMRRKTFASAIVDALKSLSAPSRIEGVSFFDPTRVLRGLLPRRSHEDICRVIGLPLALTSRTTESEESSALVPSTANFLLRINDCHLALMAPPARLNSGDTLTPSATTQQALPKDGPRSTPMLTSTGVSEDADRFTNEEIEAERNASPNPLTQHILNMNYPWDTTFDVPLTPNLGHTGSWATDTTSDLLEIPGPSVLDFNLDWDNNFALQQRMEVEAQPAITGSHTP